MKHRKLIVSGVIVLFLVGLLGTLWWRGSTWKKAVLEDFMRQEATRLGKVFVQKPLYKDFDHDKFSYLTRSAIWSSVVDHVAFDVPVGFVTDFASIPWCLRAILPRKGNLAYPAIVHDYLYWKQSEVGVTRAVSDNYFREAMLDEQVGVVRRTLVYKGVDWFGGFAWAENAAEKSKGGFRIIFPSMPPPDKNETWADYKARVIKLNVQRDQS